MFEVIRSPQPSSWSGKNYRDPTIVRQLQKDFYSKCYLCEQKHMGDINVEHFIAHKNDNDELKYDWNNLYNVCIRCNSIKGQRFNDLLDCCNHEHLVSTTLMLALPSLLNGNILVSHNLEETNDLFEKANQTVQLLTQCYNAQNSGIQEVSRAHLIELIVKEYTYLLAKRVYLKENIDRLVENDKNKVISEIKLMTNPHYQFSSFWINFIKNDPFLNEIIGLC